MKKLNQKGIGAVAVISILFVAGAISFAGWKIWGSKSDSNKAEPTSVQSSDVVETKKKQKTVPKEVRTGVVITTGDSEFGPMLFNDQKQAIYIFELEESSKAECYGNCAELWPPVLTDGTPRSAGDVNGELLGTTKRTDGSTQVTYNGHPLYYYAHENAGEVKCHNIRTHGGLWWVIKPNGNRAD